MKIILVGYPGSRTVRKASKYLVDKYLKGFEIVWLEYPGQIEGWSNFVADYLQTIEDKKVIFALDDYLISGPVQFLDTNFGQEVCAKLCDCTREENEEYPVTTQFTLWDREYLVSLLKQTTDPWDFEVRGSRIFKEQGMKMSHRPAFKYDVHSALSKRWEGIKLDGLSEQDVKEVQKCF